MQIFQENGAAYARPHLVLFEDATPTARAGQVAMEPLYRPNDEKLYIDLSFFRALKARFGAPGDFAAAIGDDRLQLQTQGRAVPESITTGSSEQRVRWLQIGMESRRPAD